MPSKVASLAVVGASAYGASTMLSAFVAPGAPSTSNGVQQESRRLRQSRTQVSDASFAASVGAGVWGVGVAAAAVGMASLKDKRSTRQSKARVAMAAEGDPVLRLGTRGSPLALAQAYETKGILQKTYSEMEGDDAVDIRIISTTGDQRLEVPLSALGGKGLFTRELDVALASEEVEFCVHSTKDVPTELIPNSELIAMLPREDTRDVLICRDPSIKRIEDLPAGSVIGTASLRRQAQIYSKNPDVTCVNFRGNVQTRLRKLAAGEVDATLLAYAGLRRMNMEEHATEILDWDQMLPAISQGAISLQCRSDDKKTVDYLAPLSCKDTMQTVTCERAFLAALDGNCKTPIAGQAKIIDGELHFQGLVSSPDGKQYFRAERKGSPEDATAIGRDAGMEIRKEAGEQFFEDMQDYVQQVQAANTKPTKKPA